MAKSEPFERREHRQLVVRPFDRRQRRADRFDFLATVKRLASDEQVRDRRALRWRRCTAA